MRGRTGVGAAIVLLLAGCTAEGPPPAAREDFAPREPQKAYLYYCGGCHAAPRPGSYTAPEWPAIVSRMQQRRIGARLGPVPPEQLRMILDYLQENAAGTGGPS